LLWLYDVREFYAVAAEVRLGFAYVENSTLRIEGLQVYMSATHEIFSKREWSAKKRGTRLFGVFAMNTSALVLKASISSFQFRPYCKVPNADMVR
jgi:hypothetical protein